ncbi:MAG: hypothetical protein IT489_06605 [Gammaproteobacteria bacterium]|nr:hypothetical protein [Gammaproteobacteria bacterium]
MAKRLRIALLSLILVLVALNAWFTQRDITGWEQPLRVAIYPIDADRSPVTAHYIAGLRAEAFQPIEEFFRREIGRYGRGPSRPVEITLAPPPVSAPPELPQERRVLQILLWSLRLRYWAWTTDAAPGPAPQIRLFVQYYDPARFPRLDHSVGLSKGALALIKAFATRTMDAQNNVIIAHELLHTLGASDKYDPRTNLPRYPDGYAEPEREPRYPQTRAEIMAGRTPLSPNRAETPPGLPSTVVGPATAREIGWLD